MYVGLELDICKFAKLGQDYVNACERLAQLNLTEIQQREVVRVLVNCCGNVGIHPTVLWLILTNSASKPTGKCL